VRETSARRWTALLIAASVNKLRSNVAGSMKLMAAMKALSSGRVEENEKGRMRMRTRLRAKVRLD
jgi:hypothetical protein